MELESRSGGFSNCERVARWSSLKLNTPRAGERRKRERILTLLTCMFSDRVSNRKGCKLLRVDWSEWLWLAREGSVHAMIWRRPWDACQGFFGGDQSLHRSTTLISVMLDSGQRVVVAVGQLAESKEPQEFGLVENALSKSLGSVYYLRPRSITSA